jgi:H/ACA ribonucleoprotein complex subunit 4
VTGVLPIALEESRKIVQALLHSGKEYVGVMKLHKQVVKELVLKVMKEFQGKIYQRPPIRASVKRRLRTRTIYYLNLLEMEEKKVLFKVGCEAGTYIRKLCHDIGEVLGCGAHMQELRRTRAGPFTEREKLAKLHEIAYWYTEWQKTEDDKQLRKLIYPMEEALALIPKIYIRDSAVDAICHGALLTAPGVTSVETGIIKDSLVAILTLKGEAVALAKTAASTDEIMNMDHGIVAESRRVLMYRGTYPKYWRSGEPQNVKE